MVARQSQARALRIQADGASAKVRIWAISDLHTDDHHNKEATGGAGDPKNIMDKPGLREPMCDT